MYKSGSPWRSRLDPVNYITHVTGFWTLWLLVGSLAVTPVRRLQLRSWGNLIRFRRLLGAVCVFLRDAASVHVPVFVLEGYDLTAVIMQGCRRRTSGSVIVAEWKQVWPTILG